jgi:hypothetical protein
MATRKAGRRRSSKVRIPLNKGELDKFGYSNVKLMTETQRHAALVKAMDAYGKLSVFRKLNAIYVLTRNTSPASSKIFKADRDWIKARFGFP